VNEKRSTESELRRRLSHWSEHCPRARASPGPLQFIIQRKNLVIIPNHASETSDDVGFLFLLNSTHRVPSFFLFQLLSILASSLQKASEACTRLRHYSAIFRFTLLLTSSTGLMWYSHPSSRSRSRLNAVNAQSRSFTPFPCFSS
jgi:hypothetical protein